MGTQQGHGIGIHAWVVLTLWFALSVSRALGPAELVLVRAKGSVVVPRTFLSCLVALCNFGSTIAAVATVAAVFTFTACRG